MSPDVRWEVPQTIDTIDPLSPHYNPKSAYAKTLRRDGKTWGAVRATVGELANAAAELAHDNCAMDCQICHTSWATSCFGCHLPMKANQRVPQNKFEGVTDRNYTTYNPQVVRDDVFMLGIDGTVKKNRMAVIRSSSAVVVSSQNANREWVYSQQQTFSAEGYSGQAFNPHFPHTTSGVGTTKNCTDCHLSKSERQQRLDDAIARLRHRHGEFLRPLRLRRRRPRRIPRRGLDRTGRTAGGHRQSSAYDSLTRPITRSMSTRGAHSDRSATSITRQRHSGHRFARRISLHREWSGRVRSFRCREHRPERIFRTDRELRRFRRSVSARACHTKYATSRRAAEHARARSGARNACRKTKSNRSISSTPSFTSPIAKKDSSCSNVATLVDGNPDNNFLKQAMSSSIPNGVLTGATFVTAAGHRLYMTTPRGLVVIDVERSDASASRSANSREISCAIRAASRSSFATHSSPMTMGSKFSTSQIRAPTNSGAKRSR